MSGRASPACLVYGACQRDAERTYNTETTQVLVVLELVLILLLLALSRVVGVHIYIIKVCRSFWVRILGQGNAEPGSPILAPKTPSATPACPAEQPLIPPPNCTPQDLAAAADTTDADDTITANQAEVLPEQTKVSHARVCFHVTAMYFKSLKALEDQLQTCPTTSRQSRSPV